MQIVILLLIVAVIALLVLLLLRYKPAPAQTGEIARLQTIVAERDRQIAELQKKAALADELAQVKARLEADLANERRNAEEKMKLLQESEARLKTEFENLANKIFEEKGKAVGTENREKLDILLKPFREQMESFRQRVDAVHKDDTEGLAKLLEQVRQLQETSFKVGADATNLALALKGDAKRQGNWGELVIERIFESSGLAKGREYETQAALRAEDGSLQRPDFIVYLPGQKSVIVDAKVSLTAYERFCSLPDGPERVAALKEHVASVRKHVDELKAKEYHHLLGGRTLDFVILCVPVEPAYQLAMQTDEKLFYDLAGGRVVVCGPTTLMITLKLIAQVWRRGNENRNSAQIAEKAGRLYDQFTLLYDGLLDAQKKMGGVQETFETALKRLHDGKGNLVGKVEELKKLGAKTSKQMPAGLLAEPAADDDAQPA
jgi:DNA recombination protein RmuC